MGSKAPAPPDYLGMALAQAGMSQDLARQQTWANRPDINTPFGNVSWSVQPGAAGAGGTGAAPTGAAPTGASPAPIGSPGRPGGGLGIRSAVENAALGATGMSPDALGAGAGGDPERWTMTMGLPPEMQAALESQQRVTRGRSEMAEGLLGRAGQSLSQGLDWNSLQALDGGMGARNRAEDAIYQRATSRLDPQFQQQENSLRTRLYNQGLREGDAAFDQEMQNFARTRNDAYQSARDAAIMGGGQEMSRQFQQDLISRQQGISEGLQKQYGDMNALNAFLAGQQVAQPNMPGFMGASVGQAPNLLGAAQSLGNYNMNSAQMGNQMMGSLFGAGASLGMAGLM